MQDNTTQIYDKIFKRILTLSGGAVINFINATFEKNFPSDSEIIYNWTENVKDDLEKTIADTIITINQTEKFHIEVQINNDSAIVLRVFDYGYQDALKYKKISTDKITITFPKSKIIFLEHNSNTPDEVTLELDFLEQGKFEYRVPAMRFLSYSLEELNRQHLVILMPLYLLKLRREIEKSKENGTVRENATSLKKLMNDGILKTIEENQKNGNITQHDALILIGSLSMLYDHLYGKIKEFNDEGVKSMLAEKLIFDFEIKLEEALKEAKKIAAEKADEQSRLDVAGKLLAKGMLIDDIADATSLPIDKIKMLQTQQ